MAEENPPVAPAPRRWSVWLDRGVLAALAMLFLYRCVLPQPRAAAPELASVQLAAASQPVFIDLSSTR